MEIVVLIIMCLVGLVLLLKLTFHGWPGRMILSLAAAIFIVAATDPATEQSKTQIADWLSCSGLMLDASVLLTVDVAFQIGFCILAAGKAGGFLDRKGMFAYRLLLWIPGLMIFPVLFALLTALVFAMPGVDFQSIGLGCAMVILIVMPLLAWFLKSLLPEYDIRVELMFLIGVFVACLGIVATVNGRTAAIGTNDVDWSALAMVGVLLVSGLVVGYATHRSAQRRRLLRGTKMGDSADN